MMYQVFVITDKSEQNEDYCIRTDEEMKEIFPFIENMMSFKRLSIVVNNSKFIEIIKL